MARAFKIEFKYACISALVKASLEKDTESKEVPLPGVKSPSLKLVVEYMRHHAAVEPAIVESPLRSKLMKDVCKDTWDAEFIDTVGDNRQALYDLILAANYMDIKSLLHLGCAKVASLIKGQPLEKIKDILSKNIAKKGDESKSEAKSNGEANGVANEVKASA